VFSFFVGLADGKACPLAAGLECQVPALGQKAATECPAIACEPVSVQVKAAQTKPIVVRIQATKDGVLLQTSNGTQVRAQSLQLETHSLGKVQIESAEAVRVSPYATPQPVYSAPQKYPSPTATPYPNVEKTKPASTTAPKYPISY
jgi:hypothetical protein